MRKSIQNKVLSIKYLKLNPKRFTLNPSAGFTFVELIIYMGILSIMILLLTNIFTQILDSLVSSRNTSSVAQDGRFIYSRFIYDINRAQSVLTPTNLGDISTTLQTSSGGKIYKYSLNGTDLTLNDGTTIENLNSEDTSVKDLSFQRIGNPSGKHTFQILFKVESKIPLHGVTDIESFQTTAGLR